MDAKYINKNYLEDSIKDYDTTIIDPIRNTASNIYHDTANSFNSVNNTFNNVNAFSNDRYNDLIKVIDMSTPGGIGLDLQLNYINSTSPVNYQGAWNIIFTPGQIGNLWCATPDKAGTQYYDWNSQTRTLTFSSLTGIITANANMDNMFNGCYGNFIGNIIVPNNATTMNDTFHGCSKFNQNILIPNSVTSLSKSFYHSGFNQNILIPNSVTNMDQTFGSCLHFNQNILIPNSVTSLMSTFEASYNFNQNILIPNSVTSLSSTFWMCINLNQNILIPNSVTALMSTFSSCNNLNQNILIPNSVTSLSGTFQGCTKLNQNILIPNSVTDMNIAFMRCTSLSLNDIYIYSCNVRHMSNAFDRVAYIGNVHVPTSVPKDTSNYMYNCLVNGNAGITFAPENIINDLPVDIAQWPPV